MTSDDIQKIHELEALLAQAMGILIQVNDAVVAMKPTRKTRKMTKSEMMTQYENLLNARRHEKRAN